jgi:type IV secretory pathway TrbL component
MNRTVLIGALVVVLAALGYYQFSVVPGQRAEAERQAAEAAAAAEQAAADAARAAEEAAAAAGNAASEAAGAAAGAAESAVEGAAAAASDAASAVTEAASEAAGAVAGAASDAAASVTDAANMVWDSTKLTGEEILARIQSAPITDEMKQTLTASYNAVKDNAAGVQTVLDQLRQEMGL